MPNPEIKILRAGDTSKPNPYTIAIINNPTLEISGRFRRDSINDNRQLFEESVAYIYDCLFGNLSHQAEKFLNHPSINSKIKVISVWISGFDINQNTSLIEVRKNIFAARQDIFKDFFAELNLNPDVVLAVTNYSPRKIASGFRTIDDENKDGEPFEYDGNSNYKHLYWHEQPGAIAIHAKDDSMTALHEFSHAASSYPNGYIADLYNNSKDEKTLIANKKFGDEIPNIFCTYNGITYLSDTYRNEEANKTYHAQRIDPNFPALMDDYRFPQNGFPEQCQHDKLTRQFLLDRILAKTMRPSA